MSSHRSASRRALLAAAALVAAPAQAPAALTFVFDYTSAPDFDATSMASLEDAAATLGSWFNDTATITMQVTSSNADSSRLASAGTNYAGFGTAGFNNLGVVANKILNGTDSNGAAPDGAVDVNFFHNWDFDDDVAPDAVDFKSTAIHELLHAVGFASSILEDGMDGYGTAPGSPGAWEPFDRWVSGPGGTIINPTTFALDQSAWDAARLGGPGAPGLAFTGPNAMALNGGNPVYIYSPTSWEGGSSGSHTDDEFYLPTNLLMGAATGDGLGARTLTAMERGMLMDLGYNMVPEPAAALLVALVVPFAALRRRRRA